MEPPASKIPRLETETEEILPSPPILDPNESQEITESLEESTLIIPEELKLIDSEPSTSTTVSEPKPVEKKPVPILKPALKSSKFGGTEGKGKDASPQKVVFI